ncbi:hypothetical protein SAY87_017866 [Trapa incisa]|uniref:Uncharacterized protein n=1 Tax=Trapa incisa TaxID=236973 RepID=A0AAN7QS90_9MYRT|nr:hypothetical protein SAY87_017866 [Trapa incisa]
MWIGYLQGDETRNIMWFTTGSLEWICLKHPSILIRIIEEYLSFECSYDTLVELREKELGEKYVINLDAGC